MFIMKRRLNLGILVKLDSAFPDAYCHFKIFDRLEKNPIGTMPQQGTISIGTMPQQKAPFQMELCHNRRHHFHWNYATTEGTISIGTMPQQKAPFQLEPCYNRRHHFRQDTSAYLYTCYQKMELGSNQNIKLELKQTPIHLARHK